MTDKESWVPVRCERCSSCCRDSGRGAMALVPTEGDIQRLAEYFKLSREEVRKNFMEGDALNQKGNGDCAFLVSKLCTIYPARPEQCQEIPAGHPFCQSAREFFGLK